MQIKLMRLEFELVPVMVIQKNAFGKFDAQPTEAYAVPGGATVSREKVLQWANEVGAKVRE